MRASLLAIVPVAGTLFVAAKAPAQQCLEPVGGVTCQEVAVPPNTWQTAHVLTCIDNFDGTAIAIAVDSDGNEICQGRGPANAPISFCQATVPTPWPDMPQLCPADTAGFWCSAMSEESRRLVRSGSRLSALVVCSAMHTSTSTKGARADVAVEGFDRHGESACSGTALVQVGADEGRFSVSNYDATSAAAARSCRAVLDHAVAVARGVPVIP